MGIRLVGLKSTELTSANAQNREKGWRIEWRQQEQLLIKACFPRSTQHPPPIHTSADLFMLVLSQKKTQQQPKKPCWYPFSIHKHKLWEWFKLEDNLMHKVALSPHVISVWIRMDYWITRASTGRERDRQRQKILIAEAWRTLEECICTDILWYLILLFTPNFTACALLYVIVLLFVTL